MKMFRDLNEQQEQEFRAWARKTYQPLTPINGVWHPVVQDECAKINAEAGKNVFDSDGDREFIAELKTRGFKVIQ
jgi:hypothetical protein